MSDIFVRITEADARRELAGLTAVLEGRGNENQNRFAWRAAQWEQNAIVEGHPELQAELRAAAKRVLESVPLSS